MVGFDIWVTDLGAFVPWVLEKTGFANLQSKLWRARPWLLSSLHCLAFFLQELSQRADTEQAIRVQVAENNTLKAKLAELQKVCAPAFGIGFGDPCPLATHLPCLMVWEPWARMAPYVES